MALCFLLVSSVFGAIAVPNHTELERSLTPAPLPTAPPQPTPPTVPQTGNHAPRDETLSVIVVLAAAVGAGVFTMILVLVLVSRGRGAPPPAQAHRPSDAALQREQAQAILLEKRLYHSENDRRLEQRADQRERLWLMRAAEHALKQAAEAAEAARKLERTETDDHPAVRNSRRSRTSKNGKAKMPSHNKRPRP
jgi:hypothetical protein